MISVRKVNKYYKLKDKYNHVLKDVSIDFKKGVNTAILGLNGAGKSTLIRLIGNAEKPDSGDIIRTSTVSWPVGFSGGFHGSLTGKDNLKFISRIYGADIKKVTKFVEDFTELGTYMDMPYNTYSSGMRSKLSFGLSLAIDFDFYLIDEAFSVGDATFVAKATAELNKLKQRANLIYVSHSPASVMAHCNAGAVLYKGRLTYFDKISDAMNLYNQICQKIVDQKGIK